MGSERENSKREKERKMKIPIVLFVTCVASIKAASLVESFSEEQCPAHCCESTTTQAPTPPLIPQLTLQQILQLTLQEHQQQKHLQQKHQQQKHQQQKHQQQKHQRQRHQRLKHQRQTHQRQKLKMQQLIQTTLQTLQTLQKN